MKIAVLRVRPLDRRRDHQPTRKFDGQQVHKLNNNNTKNWVQSWIRYEYYVISFDLDNKATFSLPVRTINLTPLAIHSKNLNDLHMFELLFLVFEKLDERWIDLARPFVRSLAWNTSRRKSERWIALRKQDKTMGSLLCLE